MCTVAGGVKEQSGFHANSCIVSVLLSIKLKESPMPPYQISLN